MEGGPFDTVHFYEARLRRPGLAASDRPDTDLSISNAELTFAWGIPGSQPAAPGGVRGLVLTGVIGVWDLATPAGSPIVARSRRSALLGGWLDRLSAWLVPAEIFVQCDDCALLRNRCRLRARGLRLNVERGTTGLLLARELEIAGPGFENTLFNRHGRTLWQGNRLTLTDLDFGPGVRLLEGTLDGSHLDRQRLDWEGSLTVMGGEIRGQGAINFVHPRLALEVAGTLRRMPVAPLARLLGLTGPAGGSVEQGSFSFRGDPEDWTSAQMWLAARATDFRWGAREWQNLELRATVLHRRIQLSHLELQQSGNRVSLTGDCPLLSTGQLSGRWWESGFACNVDARLEDLHDLARLFGARLPEIEGRMSINGTLETTPGRPGMSGYLNVEGSRLRIRGAPLDYLHSTLLFRGDELSVADLQATHGNDYFAGRGSVSLDGPVRYDGEIQVAMSDADVYARAFAGVIDFDHVWGNAAAPEPAGRLEAFLFGPDADGRTIFVTFDDLLRLPVPPANL